MNVLTYWRLKISCAWAWFHALAVSSIAVCLGFEAAAYRFYIMLLWVGVTGNNCVLCWKLLYDRRVTLKQRLWKTLPLLLYMGLCWGGRIFCFMKWQALQR